MTDQEVNKIIAEFMGGPYEGDSINCGVGYETISSIEEEINLHYVKSLDALVPVWEKISFKRCSPRFSSAKYRETPYFCEIYYSLVESNDWCGSYEAVGKTIQQAAAHATAKAILELKK